MERQAVREVLFSLPWAAGGAKGGRGKGRAGSGASPADLNPGAVPYCWGRLLPSFLTDGTAGPDGGEAVRACGALPAPRQGPSLCGPGPGGDEGRRSLAVRPTL